MQNSEFLFSMGETMRKPKFEHVFRQGDSDDSLYVLKSGLLKAYYLTLDGKEFVKSFIMPGSLIGSMTACHAKQSCSFSLRCLQDSELVKISADQLKQLALENHQVAGFMLNGLLELSMKKERREYEFLCLSPEQRYQLLVEREPQLLEQVTQNDIARYLGITPVALSRIKNRQ
ncbi:MAG: Crp/Fnr family transcriptional regulator [Pseudomonadota bacterium]